MNETMEAEELSLYLRMIKLICIWGPTKWKPPWDSAHVPNLNPGQPALMGNTCQGNLTYSNHHPTTQL